VAQTATLVEGARTEAQTATLMEGARTVAQVAWCKLLSQLTKFLQIDVIPPLTHQCQPGVNKALN
jgi:hypothetical protein